MLKILAKKTTWGAEPYPTQVVQICKCRHTEIGHGGVPANSHTIFCDCCYKQYHSECLHIPKALNKWKYLMEFMTTLPGKSKVNY